MRGQQRRVIQRHTHTAGVWEHVPGRIDWYVDIASRAELMAELVPHERSAPVTRGHGPVHLRVRLLDGGDGMQGHSGMLALLSETSAHSSRA